MSESTYSLVYDQLSADAVFHGIAPRELTLSILATLVPEEGWEGCLVYRGPSPLGDGSTCLATSGPGAGDVQLRLTEAFERLSVRVLQVFEGGPDVDSAVAIVRNGTWTQP
jgi:hypothetical protein